MEYYNGLVLAGGQRIPFSLKPCAHISVDVLTIRNHPAYSRSQEARAVFATAPIEKHTRIGLFAGALEADSNEAVWNPYQIAPSTECDYFIDASLVGNEMRYINDYRNVSAAPNVGFFKHQSRVKGYLVSVVVALRDIATGEELLTDYGAGYWEETTQWRKAQNPFVCTECDYRTHNAKNLRQHGQRVHDVKLFYDCTHCDRQYATLDGLAIHLNQVNGSKLYTCEQCDYSSYVRTDVPRHVQKEHSTHAFKCLQCNSEFMSKYHLKRHVDGFHKNIKTFLCEVCNNYASAYKHDVKKHKIRHH